MDILYILGKGSPFQNEELKYSLRSLERYGKNIGNIILVGEKPNFLDYTKVLHIPFEEKGVKDYRIAAKILHACKIGAVRGNFLFCNDDFFFMKKFDCNTFPYYQKGQLYHGDTSTGYSDHLKLTRDFLKTKERPTLHFDVHCPIIYNADNFMQLEDCWNYSRDTIGMVVKSVYANMFYLRGPIYHDVKLKELITKADYDAIERNECFSIYDQAWNRGVHSFLVQKFINKSQWEL